MLKRIPKSVLYSVLYYIIAITAGLYFNYSANFKSTPNAPKLDNIWPLLVVIGALIFLIVFAIRAFIKKDKASMYAMLIHFGMLGLAILAVMFNIQT